MEQRIHFGKNPPFSFRESLHFDLQCPYHIRCKDFLNDDIAPLHYADTMEIEVCCGIQGNIQIETTSFSVDGNAVVVIPPGAVHAVTIRKGPGKVYVIHLSFDALRAFIDVDAMLEQSGKTLVGIAPFCGEFEKIHGLVLELIARDGELFPCMRALLEILETLAPQMRPRTPSDCRRLGSREGEQLRRLLRWTEENLTEPIRLEQAAAVAGFSKNYFCVWFKEKTGQTYNRYLNNVRIRHACRLLAKTGSISQACCQSGFQDMSYFIQLFRKTQGCTPKTYLRNLSE